MEEQIYNLYIFLEDRTISEIGIVEYKIEGSDEEKLAFLQDHSLGDIEKASQYDIPKYFSDTNNGMTYPKWHAMARMGIHLFVFEKVLQSFNAPESPLHCVTPIENGKAKIEETAISKTARIKKAIVDSETGKVIFEDYLEKYAQKDGFDLAGLLKDDYFKAIKLLFNEGYFVSSLKLLVSFIDTLAFIEYGDERDIFKKWLNNFANLQKTGITAEELWELRNSIIHMTNSESRKVASGKINRLNFYVASADQDLPDHHKEENVKYFNLKTFIDSVPQTIEKWGESYKNNPNKFAEFVMRYDKVISDVRQVNIK